VLGIGFLEKSVIEQLLDSLFNFSKQVTVKNIKTYQAGKIKY